MGYDFDEVISRDGTASVADEAYLDFLLDGRPSDQLPPPEAELLSMWVADMDIAPPDVALDAMRARLDRKILGYTLDADDRYRAAFAGWCRRWFDWSFDDEHLHIGRGVVPTLVDLVAVLARPGEKVVTLTPAYHWFEDAVDRNSVELVTCPLSYVDGRAVVDLDRLDAVLADPDVALLLFCHPHNPVGRDWSVEELTAVADRCRTHGVRIVSDEIHADLLRTGRRHVPFALCTPAADHVITCMAPSKTFNLAGLQFSNVIIPDPEVAAAWKERQVDVSNPLSLAAATAVYEDGDDWLMALRDHIDRNLELVGQVVGERWPSARFVVPEATYLAWIDLGDHVAGIDDITAFFAREAHVLLEGPEKFVADGGTHIRLNVACPTAKVLDALDRMTAAFERRTA